MPWKDRYTISDERGIADGDVRWPEGRTCCFTITVDLSPTCGPEGITPRDLLRPDSYYGLHGGLTTLREVLGRHNLRVTFAVPAAIADLYPALIRALLADGHEIAAHGWLHEDVSQLSIEEERGRLTRTTDCIEAACGKRPLGWYSLPRQGDKFAVGAISPNTMTLLGENGYLYMGNSPADDVPHYWVTDPSGPRAILAMPYYYHFDDQFFLLFPAKGTGLEHADTLARNWEAELAAQYKRGRAFGMTLHPHAIAWPNRLQKLDEFLDRAGRLPGLWNATALECAEHWSRLYPVATALQLEPSIWQDYPDSLS